MLTSVSVFISGEMTKVIFCWVVGQSLKTERMLWGLESIIFFIVKHIFYVFNKST